MMADKLLILSLSIMSLVVVTARKMAKEVVLAGVYAPHPAVTASAIVASAGLYMLRVPTTAGIHSHESEPNH